MKKVFAIFALYLIGCSSPIKETSTQTPEQKAHRKGIIQTMTKNRRYVSQCYSRSLAKKGNEHLKGLVMVQFNIGHDGKAHSSKIIKERSTIRSPELSKCLISGIETWSFPTHPDGVDAKIKYPFRFAANPPKNMQKKLDLFEKFNKSRRE